LRAAFLYFTPFGRFYQAAAPLFFARRRDLAF